jgi:hypothetical protein
MNVLLLYWKPLLIAAVLALVAFMGYRAGGNAVRVDFEAAAILAQGEYAAALAQANTERDAEAAKHTDLQAAASASSQQLKLEAQNANDKLAAAVRNGTQRVYVTARCPATGDRTVPQTATDPGRPAITANAELDSGVAANTVAYGGRANILQLDYNRCYQALMDDRK